MVQNCLNGVTARAFYPFRPKKCSRIGVRDVNKARGSKAKAPSLKAKAKACQFNARPGQGQGRIP